MTENLIDRNSSRAEIINARGYKTEKTIFLEPFTDKILSSILSGKIPEIGGDLKIILNTFINSKYRKLIAKDLNMNVTPEDLLSKRNEIALKFLKKSVVDTLKEHSASEEDSDSRRKARRVEKEYGWDKIAEMLDQCCSNTKSKAEQEEDLKMKIIRAVLTCEEKYPTLTVTERLRGFKKAFPSITISESKYLRIRQTYEFDAARNAVPKKTILNPNSNNISLEEHKKRGLNGGRKADLGNVKRALELKIKYSLTQKNISIRLETPVKTISWWLKVYTLENGEAVLKSEAESKPNPQS